jgi:TRAP-type transport system periplasmic protein
MKVMSRRSAGIAMALTVAAALALPGAAAAQRKFSFAYDQPHSTAYGIAADLFDAKLQELSGGKLGIN